MAKLSKRVRAMREKVEAGKLYPVEEAVALLKELSGVKFAETVDVAGHPCVRAAASPRKIRASNMGIPSPRNVMGTSVAATPGTPAAPRGHGCGFRAPPSALI